MKSEIVFPVPTGSFYLKEERGAIIESGFVADPAVSVRPEDNSAPVSPLLKEGMAQVSAWMKGDIRRFDLPVCYTGTAFQMKVWETLTDIPYGETLSYSALSRQAGYPAATRAAALACKNNMLLLIIPCHRVVRKDLTAGGYVAGIKIKRWLLRHEQQYQPCKSQ